MTPSDSEVRRYPCGEKKSEFSLWHLIQNFTEIASFDNSEKFHVPSYIWFSIFSWSQICNCTITDLVSLTVEPINCFHANRLHSYDTWQSAEGVQLQLMNNAFFTFLIDETRWRCRVFLGDKTLLIVSSLSVSTSSSLISSSSCNWMK